MNKLHALLLLFVFSTAHFSADAQDSGNSSSRWLTLNGDAPLVIARGGFSGMFPASSGYAYSIAVLTSLPNVILWCDIQLSKDGVGICFQHLNLEAASTAASVFSRRSNEYIVNGVSTRGWFTLDFTMEEITRVSLNQDVFSRTPRFDGQFPILTVEEVADTPSASAIWLNIQHSLFYEQHNLSMRNYVISLSRRIPVISYISSPEVAFLRSIRSRLPRSTKLVLSILAENEADTSTNSTYGSILRNLTFVATFASGILVDKSYIWPTKNGYLQPYTSLVSDAHRNGLQVFASTFANDNLYAYNTSYNPVEECIYFIANGDFSIDGFLSDFPITPSEAVGCFSQPAQNNSRENPLIISYGGAGGNYPSCTDIAYEKAIEHADVIDCPVQLTKDNVPICLSSINLIESTNVLNTSFINSIMSIPELHIPTGIFTFNLSWEEIKSLTPTIQEPYFQIYGLRRNPLRQHSGNFISLSDFLSLAKNASIRGVLIKIENAAYLAQKLRFSITDTVLDALKSSGYLNQTGKTIMIQSTNSSVLREFEGEKNIELVYAINEDISSVDTSAIEDISKLAHSVVITKNSSFSTSNGFVTSVTKVVSELHSRNITVYSQLFSNEFISQSWDFFSDTLVEINSFVSWAGIDGVVTDYPKSAFMYKNNLCSRLGDNAPPYMIPVEPGSLLQALPPEALPPALPPSPSLQDADVTEPPLPSILTPSPEPNRNGSSTIAPTSSNQPRAVSIGIFPVFVAVAAILLV